MSSRSSSSVSSRRSRSSATRSRSPSLADSISMPARVTRRAKRSGRIAASPRPLERAAARRLAQRPVDDLGRLEAVVVAVVEQAEPALGFLAQLVGRQHLGVLAPAQDPGDQLAGRGVVGLEDRALAGRAVGLLRRAQLSVGAEVALDQPGDAVADEDLRGAADLAQLPVGALAVVAAVEVLGRREVVLGLGGVADLALDPGEAEDPHRVALVRSGRSSRTGRRGRRGGRGRPCASRCRRAPSCSR